MNGLISHRHRLAWDGARAVMTIIEAGHHAWLGQLLNDRLGPEYRGHVEDSRRRIMTEPVRGLAEAGLWRARLEDLLSQRPELTTEVAGVVDELAPYARQYRLATSS